MSPLALQSILTPMTVPSTTGDCVPVPVVEVERYEGVSDVSSGPVGDSAGRVENLTGR